MRAPRRTVRRFLRMATACFAVVVTIGAAGAADPAYLVGRGIADITGPASDLMMFGFAKPEQTTAGIHIRLRSRAFIVAGTGGGPRVALAVADLGALPHEIQRAVVESLHEKYGDLYGFDNTIVAATHTHSGPAGYTHYGAGSNPLAGGFFAQHFDYIVNGIVDSIVQAHEDLAPGDIYIARGEVEGGGAQRSHTAYIANPEAERAKYGSETDKGMTLLKFVRDGKPVAVLNWFASHPTAMTFNNHLISGDHKGRAAQLLESLPQYDGVVAAFANTNCGDVTPNLNLNNTGPGKDEFDTTDIIAHREFEEALRLVESASERLTGPIDARHTFVDFSKLQVSDEFTGAGPQHTCGSAYGYAFAGGSTEDGGGHPSFREGMTDADRMPFVDDVTSKQVAKPTDEFRACHFPKAILFATGLTDPPSNSQILPLGLVRIGPLALAVFPGEITTMSGRRLRATIGDALGDSVKDVVIAAYANDFAGYTTTKEEYDTQQYEGGHTLYGPWQLAGFQQEYARIAKNMAAGAPSDDGPKPRDLRDAKLVSTPLGTEVDTAPKGKNIGDALDQPNKKYAAGDTVTASFVSANPQNNFTQVPSYLYVERETPEGWVRIADDHAWETKYHWRLDEADAAESLATIEWAIPQGTPAGTYRVVHTGAYKDTSGKLNEFTGATKTFEVN